MKRYYMSASNGAVVPHESETGRWVEWEELAKWKGLCIAQGMHIKVLEQEVEFLNQRIEELEVRSIPIAVTDQIARQEERIRELEAFIQANHKEWCEEVADG